MSHPDEDCEVCAMSDDPEECRRWTDYWDSLTPEQQREEWRMMDVYAKDAEA
jgi:hypothetical protein